MISRKNLKKKTKPENGVSISLEEYKNKISLKLEKIQKFINLGKTYTKIKFNQDYYSIGDNLMLRDINENFIVAKLKRIISYNGNKKYPFWPTIEVEWFYKKFDINKEKNGCSDPDKFDSISEYELFSSNHRDVIFIETILGVCTVLSLEEYEKLDKHSPTTFFTRASYDPIQQMIIPPFKSWETSCLCNNPLNPDQLYIKCDGCDKWYHPKHCGLSENEADDLKEFYCVKCFKKSIKSEKKY